MPKAKLCIEEAHAQMVFYIASLTKTNTYDAVNPAIFSQLMGKVKYF